MRFLNDKSFIVYLRLCLLPVLAIAVTACSQSNLELGNRAFAKKDYRNAVKHYSNAIKTAPANKQFYTYTWLGRSYYKLDKYKQALDAFNKAVRHGNRKDPKNNIELAKLHINRADALHTTASFYSAHYGYQDALSIFKNLKPRQYEEEIKLLFKIARNFNAGRRYRKAAYTYKRAFKQLAKTRTSSTIIGNNRLFTAYFLYAHILGRIGQHNRAIKTLETMLKQARKSGSGHNVNIAVVKTRIGIYWFTLGDYQKAKQSFSEALKLANKSYPANKSLLKALDTNLNRVEQALKAGSNCTKTKRGVAQKAGAQTVTLVHRIEPLRCKRYIPHGSDGSSSGPINSDKPAGQFFSYPHGRLYYRICSNFQERKNVKSFGFIEWKNRDNTQEYRVALKPVSGFCFLPGYFEVNFPRMKVILTGCKQGMYTKKKLKLVQQYRWQGDKHGCGSFRFLK